MQDTFQWTDELALEFAHKYFVSTKHSKDVLEQFKSSKSPKKEWEIVAFWYRGEVVPLMEDWQKYPCYSQPTYATEGQQISLSWGLDPANSCIIHSVRRLSDGEVVSLRDKTDNGYVNEFKIGVSENGIMDNNQMYVSLVAKIGDPNPCAGLSLRRIKKLPQPVLTTVDQKELFENDQYWIVWNDHDWEISYSHVAKGAAVGPEPIFSTKEAAHEWVSQNKPLLSLNDVKEAIGDSSNPSRAYLMHQLTALVKQRLNQ